MQKDKLIDLIQWYVWSIEESNRTRYYPVCIDEFESEFERFLLNPNEFNTSNNGKTLDQELQSLTKADLELLAQDYSYYVLSTYDSHYDAFHEGEWNIENLPTFFKRWQSGETYDLFNREVC